VHEKLHKYETNSRLFEIIMHLNSGGFRLGPGALASSLSQPPSPDFCGDVMKYFMLKSKTKLDMPPLTL